MGQYEKDIFTEYVNGDLDKYIFDNEKMQ